MITRKTHHHHHHYPHLKHHHHYYYLHHYHNYYLKNHLHNHQHQISRLNDEETGRERKVMTTKQIRNANPMIGTTNSPDDYEHTRVHSL